MCVLNDLDRFHFVQDLIDRVSQLGSRAVYVRQAIRDALIDHKEYIHEHGEDARRSAAAPALRKAAIFSITRIEVSE